MILKLIVIIISIIIFNIWVYKKLPKKLDVFLRFDILIVFQIFFLILGRVFGILANWKDFDSAWTFSPLIEENNKLIFLSTNPWSFLRVWDGNWNFSFKFLLLIVALGITVFFFRKKIKGKSKYFDVFSFGLIIAMLVNLIFSLILQLPFANTGINIFNLNTLATSLILILLIILAVVLVKKYNKQAVYFVIVLIIWGLFHLFVKLANSSYINFFAGIDFYYVESFICLLFPVFYFLFVIVRQNLMYSKSQEKKETELVQRSKVSRKVARPRRVDYSRLINKKSKINLLKTINLKNFKKIFNRKKIPQEP